MINNFDSEKFGNDHYHAMGLKLQPTMAMIFSNESLTGMFTFFFLEHEKKFHFWASKGRKMGSQFSMRWGEREALMDEVMFKYK